MLQPYQALKTLTMRTLPSREEFVGFILHPPLVGDGKFICRVVVRTPLERWRFFYSREVFMKTQKFNFLSFLFVLTLGLTLVVNGCVGRDNNELKTLKIGINDWPGYNIALYGEEAGLFAKRGLDVDFIPFDNLQDASRAVLSGSLDATFSTMWDAMQVDSRKDKPALVMVTDISAGSDGIVAQKQIQSIKDLRGKKVAAKLGTVNHLILLEALQLEQIPPQEVEIVDLDNDIAQEELKKGKIDGAVLWEPSLSSTAEAIEGNILFTTKDVDSLVIDCLMTRSSFVISNKDKLTQFMLAWFDIMDAVENQPKKVFAVVANQLGQSQEFFA